MVYYILIIYIISYQYNIMENRNSRQAYTIGKDALNKMFNKSIIIYGMTPIGISIARMVIQNGAKHISLYDTNTLITHNDLRSFFIKESELGTNKKDVLLDRLKKLNPHVDISYINEELTLDKLKKTFYDVAIFCDKNMFDLIPYNELCRKNKTKFISANSFGLFGGVFCDFGDNFTTNDPNGNELSTGFIIKFYDSLTIKNHEYKNVIEIDKSKIHTLYKNDTIKIIINGKIKKKIYVIDNVINSYMLSLQECDIFNANKNITNTEFIQYREPINIKHSSLYQCITNINTNLEMTNMTDFDRPSHLFTIHKVIDMCQYDISNEDNIWDEEYTKKMINKVHVINPSISENLIRKLIYTLKGNLPMIDSIISGFASNEALKACSEKFTPFNQFFYKDEIELFPLPLKIKININNYLPSKHKKHKKHNKYDGMIIVLGYDNVKKLRNSTIFIIGAGAIGCELIMNLSLMGIKKMIITDVDTIEQSNLNRQALFDDNDIGKFKSEIAVKKGREMNNDIEYDARKNFISHETENIYNDEFYNELTCIFPAVDNIDARKYIDLQCVKYHIPMIDAGTQGTSCSVQPIIPLITDNYSSIEDSKNEEYPMCTIKNFPYKPEHLVQWSKNILLEHLGKLINSSEIKPTFENSIKHLYEIWEFYFVKQIKKIIKENPKNSVDSDGNMFWSGVKRFPQYTKFDVNNELHINFIIYGSIIHARINGCSDLDIIKKYKIDKYKNIIKNIIKSKSKSKFKLQNINNTDINSIIFEKDDDSNYHVDFITCCTNMRAFNYNMSNIDRFIVKKIAGKIIPAINTTTTVVSGLACVEFCKYKLNISQNIEQYYSTFCEMARNSLQQFQPNIPNNINIRGKNYNMWTIDSINNKMTLIELLEKYDDVVMINGKNTCKTEVIDIFTSNGSIYDKINNYNYSDNDSDSNSDSDEYYETTLLNLLKKNGDDINNDIHINIILCNKELDNDPISIHVMC
jgi:ubiquitin-activating enzyme E1